MLTAKARLSIARDIIAGWLSRVGVKIEKYPIYVQYAVTKRCNLRCRMCGAPQARAQERELSLPEIELLATRLARLGTGIVILTGGEPLLREDLPEIIATFVKKGMHTRIQTNGVLATPERVRALREAGLRELTVSLDTLEEEKQDRIANVPGTWRKCILGLAAFSQILPAANTVLGINTVVCKQNLEELPRLAEFAKATGYYLSLIPVHVSGGNGDFIVRKRSPEFEFSEDDHARIDEVYRQMIRMKRKGYPIFNSYRFLKESPDYLKFGRIHWRCESPDLYFSISPSGVLQPCVDLGGTKCMLDEDFEAAYKKGEVKSEVRRKVEKCPGCFYACWPEVTYSCNDFRVLVERVAQDFRIKARKRKRVSEPELLKLAENLRR